MIDLNLKIYAHFVIPPWRPNYAYCIRQKRPYFIQNQSLWLIKFVNDLIKIDRVYTDSQVWKCLKLVQFVKGCSGRDLSLTSNNLGVESIFCLRLKIITREGFCFIENSFYRTMKKKMNKTAMKGWRRRGFCTIAGNNLTPSGFWRTLPSFLWFSFVLCIGILTYFER